MATLAARIQSMTLEEKVGQLFTFYHSGLSYTDFADKMIGEFKVGGMFLDMDTLDHAEQVHELTAAMQRASLQKGSGIPLFVAADFVAGAGCKLPGGGAVYFPKNKAIGAAGDEELAYESGKITAVESLAIGVNFNYSPVVDINNNPLNPVIGTHSFGEDRELVSRMGCAVIRGYQEHGLIATAKHFPGHGDTQVDSHHDLPVLPFDRERLERFEMAPFRSAIEAGVDAVMVGHIAVPALDPSLMPASLSEKMVSGVLRYEMGFDGLVVTDALSMKGVTSKFTQAEACTLAIRAGADVLLAFARRAEDARPIVQAVLDDVRNGSISEERISESVARIIRVKEKYGLMPERFKLQSFSAERLDLPDYHETSLRIARKAIVPANGVKPLLESSPKWKLIRDRQVDRFAACLEEAGVVAGETVIESYVQLPEVLRGQSSEHSVLVAMTHNKRMDREVLEVLNGFAETSERPVVFVHFGSPYDVEFVPSVPTLLAHDKAPALQQAAAERLLAQSGGEQV